MNYKKVGGDGIWTEWEDTRTGETSIETHELKTVKRWCNKKHHEYKILNVGKRLAKCQKCDHETTFVVGKDTIDGDQITIN